MPNCPCNLPPRFPTARPNKKAVATRVGPELHFLFASISLSTFTMPLPLRPDWVPLLEEEERMLDEEAEEEAAEIDEEEMDRRDALEAAQEGSRHDKIFEVTIVRQALAAGRDHAV